MSSAGYSQLPSGMFMKDADGSGPYVQTAPGVFTLSATGSGGGGGGGDASAANQTTQITAEQAIQTKVTAGALSLSKLEDAASADGDAGVGMLAVRKATPANTSGTDGDYEFLQMSAGRLWTSANLDAIAGTAPTVNNGTAAAGTQRVTIASDSTGQVAAVGKAAAGATISGAPVLLGGAARTANPTAVTDGQAANVMTDKMGRLVMVQSQVRDLVAGQATTITSSTSPTTVVTAGSSGVFNDITHLSITNKSATQTIVTLSDGTKSYIWTLAANGGGVAMSFTPPLPATSSATAWTLACGTSVDSVYCNVVFVKNL